jgi:hypothetical protein
MPRSFIQRGARFKQNYCRHCGKGVIWKSFGNVGEAKGEIFGGDLIVAFEPDKTDSALAPSARKKLSPQTGGTRADASK